MKIYGGRDIRNISLVGHSGCGKTILTDAILHKNGYISEMGSVDKRTTVSDFTREEKDRRISINSSIIPVEKKGIKYNFIDTPGAFDFSGEVKSSFAATEGAVLVIDALLGLEVGTEKVLRTIREEKKPSLIFVNKLDKDDLDLTKLLGNLEENLAGKLAIFNLPNGLSKDFKELYSLIDRDEGLDGLDYYSQDMYESLREKVAESSEDLMEKYFEDEEFTEEEVIRGLRTSIFKGDLIPVIFGSGEKGLGIDELLETIEIFMPSPLDKGFRKASINGEEIEVLVDGDEDFSALVFKTIIDPFVGKLSVFKVLTGRAEKDLQIYNPNKDKSTRMGQLFYLRGKDQEKADLIVAGDIGVTSKLDLTQTGDSLSTEERPILFDSIDYPKPIYYMAIEAKDKKDEDKIGLSLNRLSEEDPTFIIERNSETKQLLIGGQGNMQLEVIIDRLKNDFDLEVETFDPKVAYRETIRGRSEVQGKHKKQSGGAGQYGDVYIRFEPSEEDFLFEEEIFGGAVPKNYFPAVEKGLEESLDQGVLGGFPVVKLKATLYDGSYHPVDSNEMAFKIAASMAFKEGIRRARPVLLEPIMKLNILVPEDYMGDVMGDMTKRRGNILGMEPRSNACLLVIAEAPQSELFNYAIDLRSMTQARGDFSMEFVRYEEVPREIEKEILEKA